MNTGNKTAPILPGGAVARQGDGSLEDCDICPFRHIGFCAAVLGSSMGGGPIRKLEGTARIRQHIYRPGDAPGRVVVLREGWAIRFVLTPDGRRQILSILIPGDMVGGEALIRDKVQTSLQALTPLTYCAFDVTELKNIAESDPGLVWTFVDICFAGREASEARIVDLGRRNAEQRIARLVLDLYRRLDERGLAEGLTIPFPLRQQTIADALGLTQVHVSRTMTALRQAGAMHLQAGVLEILDLQVLSDIAEIPR
ncbi:Crp/Fnr family transcriptional regulator, partial [Parvibaculum sp.]